MSFRRKEHTARKLAIGSAIAGAAGYLAGILTAPKSGKDTRTDIAHKAEDVKYSAEDQLQDINEELKELIKTTRVRTIALSSTARAEFSEAVIRAKDAQNKAAQLLKAVKNGEASDPELNRAVKQAKQAARNLGKYFKS
jgi:gas vesicle protein